MNSGRVMNRVISPTPACAMNIAHALVMRYRTEILAPRHLLTVGGDLQHA